MIKFLQLTFFFLFIALGGHFAISKAQVKQDVKNASFKGKLFRSDTNKPIADANVSLTREHQAYEVSTDATGNFNFDKVLPGEYTVVITRIYDNEKDIPCQLPSGRLKNEKGSSFVVLTKENKRAYLIFIKNFVLEPEQNMTKDYDLVCVSASDR